MSGRYSNRTPPHGNAGNKKKPAKKKESNRSAVESMRKSDEKRNRDRPPAGSVRASTKKTKSDRSAVESMRKSDEKRNRDRPPAGSVRASTKKTKSDRSAAESIRKSDEKKNRDRPPAGSVRASTEKTKSDRLAAKNQYTRQQSSGLLALVNNYLLAPGYKAFMWSANSSKFASVAAAKAREKMTNWDAAISYRLWMIRSVAAKEAFLNKKAAANERRAEKIAIAQAVVHARRAKTLENRAALLAQGAR